LNNIIEKIIMSNSETNSFLTFSVNEEILAIDIHSVTEVKDMQKLTNIPVKMNMVIGMLPFGDEYLPVIDCREKFGYPKLEKNSKQVYILVEFKNNDNLIKLAFTADKVLGVVAIEEKNIVEMPNMGINKVDYVKGIVKIDDQSVIVLDIQKVFSIDETLLLEQVKLETIKGE